MSVVDIVVRTPVAVVVVELGRNLDVVDTFDSVVDMAAAVVPGDTAAAVVLGDTASVVLGDTDVAVVLAGIVVVEVVFRSMVAGLRSDFAEAGQKSNEIRPGSDRTRPVSDIRPIF